MTPEEFRDGVYAQGISCGPQQSGAAECFGGGETAEVFEISGTMPDWWHMSNSHPKTGAVSRDSVECDSLYSCQKPED